MSTRDVLQAAYKALTDADHACTALESSNARPAAFDAAFEVYRAAKDAHAIAWAAWSASGCEA